MVTNDELLAYLITPKPRPFTREMREIRRTIRQTHHKMQDGTLDFQQGATLLVRLTNSLARLQLAEHQIAPITDHDPMAPVRRLLERLFADINANPPKDQA